MMTIFLVLVLGLALLVWSAGRFVEGAAATARHFGMPSLLIGMVIVGFGTSTPELVVSVFAAGQGNSGIALGNAYGSNITNISLIMGATALVSPIVVQSRVLRKELPTLIAVTALAAWQLSDGEISRLDAAALLLLFGAIMAWAVREGLRRRSDAFGREVARDLRKADMPLGRAVFWLGAGLALLMASSRALVWGAVEIARALGVSDLIIGLTVVAVGTALPELASSIIAARRGEHDIAMGNIIGSNIANTLLVVGAAGMVHPMRVGPEVLHRDISVMFALTISLFCLSYRRGRAARINRAEGAALLACYIGYTAYLATGAFTR